MHDTRNLHQVHRAATSLHGQKPRTLDTFLLNGIPSSPLATARRICSTLPSNVQRSGLRSLQQKAFISRTPRRSYLGSEASLLPSNAIFVMVGSRCQTPSSTAPGSQPVVPPATLFKTDLLPEWAHCLPDDAFHDRSVCRTKAIWKLGGLL